MEFAWDERKASANAKKHRVSFHEAATAFGILWQLLSMTLGIQRPSTASSVWIVRLRSSPGCITHRSRANDTDHQRAPPDAAGKRDL